MRKQELLDALNECFRTEESAIPLYTKHINSTLFLSDFSGQDKKEIIDVLKILLDESSMHAKVFKGLMAKVKESDQDVY